METTKIPAHRTAGEIVKLLVEAGANEILQQFSNGKLSGIRFSIDTRKRTIIYSLPARVDPVYTILARRRCHGFRVDKLKDQAERVAWRLLLRWVQSQVAMIKIGMVEAGEVFLPYAVVEGNLTFWEKAITGKQLSLPAADV